MVGLLCIAPWKSHEAEKTNEDATIAIKVEDDRHRSMT